MFPAADMKERMTPSPARQRNEPQTQDETCKCGSAAAEHFCTLSSPIAAARGLNSEGLSILPIPHPTIRPRADRRQRQKAIEQRRRDKAKDLLLQLQSLLVRCPLPCALSRRNPDSCSPSPSSSTSLPGSELRVCANANEFGHARTRFVS